jgi:hypothetical protein
LQPLKIMHMFYGCNEVLGHKRVAGLLEVFTLSIKDIGAKFGSGRKKTLRDYCWDHCKCVYTISPLHEFSLFYSPKKLLQ